MDRISVPFSFSIFDPTGGGLTQLSVEGVIRLDAVELVLEYRERTADWSGMTKPQLGPVRIARVPLDEIESIEVRGWLFWKRLIVETQSLSALGEVGWANGARLEIRLPVRVRQRAEELSATASLRLAERALSRLEAADHPRYLERRDDGSPA
jgi:hypothetical protein